MTGAQDWIDDLEGNDGSDGEEADDEPEEQEEERSSLFEENFRKLVEEDETRDMTIATLDGQVERIEDPDLLKEAIEVDDRQGATELYEDRLTELVGPSEDKPVNAEAEDIEQGDAEPSDDHDDETDDDSGVEQSENADDGDDGGEDEEGGESVAEDAQTAQEALESMEDPDDSGEDETEPDAAEADESEAETEVDVDVSSLAPDAMSREAAAANNDPNTLLVWGPEGSGKSHVAHSAPGPIAYIDTEGKATELASKFDKEIHYFDVSDYDEAVEAMEQAIDLLHAYLEQGVRGTIVVDSMTAMWEYAKVDYAKVVYQTEDLSEVNFQSELENSKDWTKIKARHNDNFRKVILETPFNVVFTSGQKEDYNAVFEGGEKQWIPDGEKWNKYAVKDVVRLRRDGEGKTVGDLRKAAATRYSFVGVEWPTWDSIYGAIEQIADAEAAEETIDLSDWPFEVVDGQPTSEPSDGDGGGDDE